MYTQYSEVTLRPMTDMYIKETIQLEGHSVERTYLRQRCSDSSRWI